MSTPREVLLATFAAALRATDPARLTRRHLPAQAPAAVLAFGKAAGPMLGAVLDRYPKLPFLGVLPQEAAGPVVDVREGPLRGELLTSAHPTPDERSVEAGRRALALAGSLGPGQELLVLVSGGGSALLCLPQGVTLAQKAAVSGDLMRAGADITALNTVRKHLSGVKGGRLAQAALAGGASVRALLLSDVVGDDPAVIASGPTVPDPTTYADALAVLDRAALGHPEVRRHLEAGLRGEWPETPSVLPGATSQVIGTNRLLLEAAARALEAQGLRTVVLGDAFTGEARDVAAQHARIIGQTPGPLALVSGGEATVTVRGPGRGGRNHEFALALALALGPQAGVWALSVGSDGVDGSAEAAGALLTPDTLTRAQVLGLDPAAALEANDSGRFFAALGDQVVTGPTGQNLNDLRVVLLPD
ncbi:glycerate kinase type-2 family protein [Deinococcus hohokamensis]|uniref:Glycerate kinase n=1 Tax=Deinococcus hohokamensis TaxID=309883 RepID=A0ABV9IDY1_9DEIO